MGYATISHVEALDTGRGPFTASTKPSASQVALYLDQTSAELDAALTQRGYVTPVATTATQARLLLQHYNALGANCLVQRAAQQSVKDDDACSMYAAALAAISAGDLTLPGAPSVDASNLPLYPTAPSPIFEVEALASLGAW